MLLGVGKPDQENQSHHDTSGYDVLHHGCHSTGVRPTDAGIDKNEANTARKLAAMSSISVQVIAIDGR